MKWSNAAHNILNILIAAIAAIATFDFAAFLPPEVAAPIIGGLAALKLVMNAIRDGIAGLVKEQPPVQ